MDNLNEIIQGCIQGKHYCQMQFYTMFYKGVYNSCYRILRRTDEAEDAMQESFIKAFNNIGALKEGVNPALWLRRIGINTSIDILRKNKFQFIDNYNFADTTESPDENYEEIELQLELVKKAISVLPKGYQLVISLHLFEGYDYEEISEILKISESTVRSQYSRARKKILELISN